jgi:hypothetical protein
MIRPTEEIDMAEQALRDSEPAAQPVDSDRQRSPSYPSIPLSEAIEKARIIYTADKGVAGTMEIIAGHLESSPKSSGFIQAIASMVRYGLLDEVEGKPRRLRVSKTAVDILLLPETDVKRIAALKSAAILPRPFAELWEQYGTNLPSDQNLVHTLVTERQFRQNTAEDLIKQYKKTIEFAKLTSSDKIDEVEKNAESNRRSDETMKWFTGQRMQPPTPPTPAKDENSPDVQTKQFPIDFEGGKKGMLFVPAVMSDGDYELLKLQMEHYLKLLKLTSVKSGAPGVAN